MHGNRWRTETVSSQGVIQCLSYNRHPGNVHLINMYTNKLTARAMEWTYIKCNWSLDEIENTRGRITMRKLHWVDELSLERSVKFKEGGRRGFQGEGKHWYFKVLSISRDSEQQANLITVAVSGIGFVSKRLENKLWINPGGL